MKQINGFMLDISDEFKQTIIAAIRSLCLKFPQKYQTFLEFLADCLRDEGGYEFKRSIVDAIFDIVYSIPASKEYGINF